MMRHRGGGGSAAMMTRMTGRGDGVTARMVHRQRKDDGERADSKMRHKGSGGSAAMMTRGRRGDGATVGMIQKEEASGEMMVNALTV